MSGYVWVVATPDQKWVYQTEDRAEHEAAELIKAKRATYAVVYRITVDNQGDQ